MKHSYKGRIVLNNLAYFRELSGVTKKDISTVLKISAHTYMAYEQERKSLDAVTVCMLSKLYNIKLQEIFVPETELSDDTVIKVSKYKDMDSQTRLIELYKALSDGKLTTATYRDIRKIKEKIADQIKTNNTLNSFNHIKTEG